MAWTIGCDNWLVRWAYLFKGGVPNQTTKSKFLFRVMVLMPGIFGWGTFLGYRLVKFLWYHPHTLFWGLPVVWLVGMFVWAVIRTNEWVEEELSDPFQEAHKVYFQ